MKTISITEGFHLIQNAEATITVYKIDTKLETPKNHTMGHFS